MWEIFDGRGKILVSMGKFGLEWENFYLGKIGGKGKV